MTSINGTVTRLSGNWTSVSANVAHFTGNSTSLNGRVSHISGNMTFMNGTITHLAGNLTQLDHKIGSFENDPNNGFQNVDQSIEREVLNITQTFQQIHLSDRQQEHAARTEAIDNIRSNLEPQNLSAQDTIEEVEQDVEECGVVCLRADNTAADIMAELEDMMHRDADSADNDRKQLRLVFWLEYPAVGWVAAYVPIAVIVILATTAWIISFALGLFGVTARTKKLLLGEYCGVPSRSRGNC